MSSQRYERVLEPIMIGDVRIPNRIARAAHSTGYANGSVTRELIEYHVARARGQVGLTIVELAAVHPSTGYGAGLRAWTDEIVDGWSDLADAVHAEGMTVFQQLWHGGHNTLMSDGTPPWSSSPVPGIRAGVVARAMTKTMIDEVVVAFAEAASRACSAGLDGVEIQAGHGYLIGQFLSPVMNQREDEYGGSLENRVRFLEEVLAATRDAVGPGYPIAVRLSANDYFDGGLGPTAMATLAQKLDGRGLIDLFDISVGTHHTLHKMIGTIFEPRGYELDDAGIVGASLSVPRLGTGRFMTLDDAEAAIASGVLDMVSMVRATIADADLVRRSVAGIKPRPCISCNSCVMSKVEIGKIRCAVNASVGDESVRVDDRYLPAATRRRVVVAGGGPAGVEAARVAAMRGHRVTLYESRPDLGGQCRLASSVPGRAEMVEFLGWHAASAADEGVRIELSTPCTSDVIKSMADGDVFVNAVGPRRRESLFQLGRPGFTAAVDDPAVLVDSWELLVDPGRTVGHAVVLDDVGHAEGFCVALRLLDRGWQVTMLSRLAEVAPRLDMSGFPAAARDRLYGAAFEFIPFSFIERVADGDVTIASLHGAASRTVRAQAVVPVLFPLPNTDLALVANQLGVEVHTIGDAASQRFLRTAVAEGNAVGSTI